MQQDGVEFYICNIVARIMHNIVLYFLFYSEKLNSGLIPSNIRGIS